MSSTQPNLRILILAAGKSTRMKSKYAKVLHRAGGRTLIEHVLNTAHALTPDISVVVGHSADQVRASISEVKFVDQKEQLGTGHAVLAARENYANYAGDVLVLPGDVPLIGEETLRSFLKFHRDGRFRASVLTADIDNPHGYGRIVRRNDHEVERIVEHRDAGAEVLKIREINSSIYVFNAPSLFDALTKIQNNNAQREYYLTDVIGILVDGQENVGAFKVMSAEEILGINTRQELAAVDRVMRRRKCESLMTEGVTIIDPETAYIDADVRIGADTVIYPSVQLYGATVIGEEATIHSFSRISSSTLGARSEVLEGCIVVDSTVGEDVCIGPYAHLRMGTTIAATAKIGNFVEIKKSSVGVGTKSMHLAYLGDATIGGNVNIGAGVITCNYDGVNKHPTVIEDGAFVGTDSQLIAPVRVGKDAYVAAGSSITEDVPPESLAIARGRQVNKPGWVKTRRKEGTTKSTKGT
jgi:bifunctional UDP-N-acetylglucosamine pyrophosphorylase/glucosamine-1-phosphate N-acetyltransferase